MSNNTVETAIREQSDGTFLVLFYDAGASYPFGTKWFSTLAAATDCAAAYSAMPAIYESSSPVAYAAPGAVRFDVF